MMNRTAVVFSVVLVSLAGRTAGQAETETGTLTVNLSDTQGKGIPGGRLIITSSQGRTVYSENVIGSLTVRLPYGHYSVKFNSDWYTVVTGDVAIDKPQCFLELASTFVPEGGNTPKSVSIKVSPTASCTGDGVLWAKLVGVYSPKVMERSVGNGGYALFEPLEEGVYVVIIVDGANVRATLPLATKGLVTVVNIKLSPCE